MVTWATYSALFGGYPWLAVLPVVCGPALWYVVRSEGGLSRMASRMLASDERSWRNPNSLNVSWFGPHWVVFAGVGTVVVFQSWPDPVSRWILTLTLAGLTIALARIELRGLRSTRDHELDVLHVAGEPATYAAVCRTCDWIGAEEATFEAASADAAAHGQPATRMIEVASPAYRRWGDYSRGELRELWDDATSNGSQLPSRERDAART